MLELHSRAPDFALAASNGKEVTCRSFAGSWLIVYFYPKDMTPGCTQQACDLRDAHAALRRLGAHIVGISRDSVPRHQTFVEAQQLNFLLLADTDAAVATAYGCFVEKNLYGRKSMGIERSTFIIDPRGNVAAIWRKVRVPNHVAQVQAKLEELTATTVKKASKP